VQIYYYFLWATATNTNIALVMYYVSNSNVLYYVAVIIVMRAIALLLFKGMLIIPLVGYERTAAVVLPIVAAMLSACSTCLGQSMKTEIDFMQLSNFFRMRDSFLLNCSWCSDNVAQFNWKVCKYNRWAVREVSLACMSPLAAQKPLTNIANRRLLLRTLYIQYTYSYVLRLFMYLFVCN
jgi:hypothetical protein